MDENFLISIDGFQLVDQSDDKVSLQTLGSYEILKDEKTVKFYEYDPDFPEKKTLSKLIISKNDMITFIKDGPIKSQLILQKGERHICNYTTQLGSLNIGTYTDKVSIDLDQNGGKIYAEYTIDINSSVTSHNKIYVTIQKVGEDSV